MNDMNTPNGINERPTELTLTKAAAYLDVSTGFLSGVCSRREIPFRRVGNRIKITMLDLDLYRAEHTVTKAGAQ